MFLVLLYFIIYHIYTYKVSVRLGQCFLPFVLTWMYQHVTAPLRECTAVPCLLYACLTTQIQHCATLSPAAALLSPVPCLITTYL